MSIQRRTVFYDLTDGIVRFWDWALVTTTLGTMAEPFNANARHQLDTPAIEFDPTDEMCRIDEIRAVPSDFQSKFMSGGSDTVLSGGVLIPRDGR